MRTRLRIRGIYSTALTRLALDGGYRVVDPSAAIRQRFGLGDDLLPPEVSVHDRADQQGIMLSGQPENVCQLLSFLQERLVDATLVGSNALDDSADTVTASIELPGAAKAALDELRRAVTPTLARHHRLRLIDDKTLDHMERQLGLDPELKAQLEEKAFSEVILWPLQKTGVARFEHIRPSGRAARLREGLLQQTDRHQVVIKRTFHEGRYDGLDLPIEKGDYGLTEVQEGGWFIRHCYYSRDGQLRGEYYNINTPVELYPYGVRYLDLEVDVIHRAGEQPFLIDREKLYILARQGRISSALEARAIEVAESVMHSLHEQRPKSNAG